MFINNETCTEYYKLAKQPVIHTHVANTMSVVFL